MTSFLPRVDDGKAFGHELAVAEIGFSLYAQDPVEGIADLADIDRRVVHDDRRERHIAAGLAVGVQKRAGIADGVAGKGYAAAAQLPAFGRHLVEDERIHAGCGGKAVGNHCDMDMRDMAVKLAGEYKPGREDHGNLLSGGADKGIDVESAESGRYRRSEHHDLGILLMLQSVIVESPDAEGGVEGGDEIAV